LEVDISVGIPTGCGLEGQGSIPKETRDFLYFITSRPALGSAQLHIPWVPGEIFKGVKLLGCETDYPSPTSAEVKNGGGIPPLPHCLHGILLN
jgi:hypothetical protein